MGVGYAAPPQIICVVLVLILMVTRKSRRSSVINATMGATPTWNLPKLLGFLYPEAFAPIGVRMERILAPGGLVVAWGAGVAPVPGPARAVAEPCAGAGPWIKGVLALWELEGLKLRRLGKFVLTLGVFVILA
jgi:hypothetical protein